MKLQLMKELNDLNEAFERFRGFLVLYFFKLFLIAFAIGRPCFRTLSPFMPERIAENNHA